MSEAASQPHQGTDVIPDRNPSGVGAPGHNPDSVQQREYKVPVAAAEALLTGTPILLDEGEFAAGAATQLSRRTHWANNGALLRDEERQGQPTTIAQQETIPDPSPELRLGHARALIRLPGITRRAIGGLPGVPPATARISLRRLR